VRCANCGLLYVNPRPDESSIWSCYPSGQFYAQRTSGIRSSGLKQRVKQTIVRHEPLWNIARRLPVVGDAIAASPIAQDIDGWIRPGKVLDIGCGGGAFLDEMAGIGWQTCGVEPDPEGATNAAANGHRIHDSLRAPELAASGPFDLVYLSHTLEHMHSPRAGLAVARQLTATHGWLIIEVPNPDSLVTWLFQSLSSAFNATHLYFFTPETLRQIVEQSGYRVCSVRLKASARQFLESFDHVAEVFATDWGWPPAARVLQDQELAEALRPLAALAERRGKGGAVRLVARAT
jgi:SAM-dependent methyltransferase